MSESDREEINGLWGRAFRPFFLGLTIFGALVIPWWSLIWVGKASGPLWLAPQFWHGHEMVFGFVAAAIAGFLLTAAANWSGNRALAGIPLILLFVLWLAGRLAFASPLLITPFSMALLDAGFLPALAFAAYWTLRGSGQWHNYGIVLIVTVLAIANMAMMRKPWDMFQAWHIMRCVLRSTSLRYWSSLSAAGLHLRLQLTHW